MRNATSGGRFLWRRTQIRMASGPTGQSVEGDAAQTQVCLGIACFTSSRSRALCRSTICCERSTTSPTLAMFGPHLAPFYSTTGRPSVEPELLIRMLIIGYCYGIRSERRLCEEVHLNLAYRWFCRLGLAGEVPDHSTFSKNRHGRFRDERPSTACVRDGAAPLSRRVSRRRRRLCHRRQPDQGRCQPPEGRRRRPGLGAGGVEPRGRRVSGRAG